MTTERTLDELLTLARAEDGSYSIDVPDGWQQGRGAFGGLVVGAMARALELEAGDPSRTLRSVTAQLFGPVMPGPAVMRTETLRAGNAVTTCAVRLLQAGTPQAHAVGVFGRARTLDVDQLQLAAPQLGDWREVESVPVSPPFGPDFAVHFEFRNSGPLPFSGGAAEGLGFIRPKNPGPDRGAAYVAACMDAWWPTVYPMLETPRPMATIDFSLQLVNDLQGLPPDAPLVFRSKCLSVREGYLVEHRELWGKDGRLIALNEQTFAVIK
ncbi:MAG: thioesterase family protein [Myxococcaceae bacterium]|nr:thioesterase family protein [Myxococcaceae bacterium]